MDLQNFEPLYGKWRTKLARLEKGNRICMQNYYSGRIRLSRPSQLQMMTSRIKGKGALKDVDAAPIWRHVSDPKEADKLWKIYVQLEYYEYKAVWASHFFQDALRQLTENPVPPVENLDMVDDPGLRKTYRAILDVKHIKERSEKEFKEYDDKAEEIRKYLLNIAEEHRKQRDVVEAAKKEQTIFEQESVRERARARVLKSNPIAKGKESA